MASLSDALVKQLLDGRYIASFATHNPNGSVRIVAVWFWFDGTHIHALRASRHRRVSQPNSTADAPKTTRPYNAVFFIRRKFVLLQTLGGGPLSCG